MRDNTVHVAFTMDCEAIAEFSHSGGPATWELGERAIRGFCDTLVAAGFAPTLFVVPRCAERLAASLREAEAAGAELGLHLHTLDEGWHEHLGGLDADEQCRALRGASDRWEQALGRTPCAFRGGNVSANDATFPTLATLGFTHGSVSVPGRNFPEVRSSWVGAPMDIHRAHRANRLLAGDIEFVEVPVTVDWESILWGGRTPLELRIEMVDARAHGFTVRKNLDRMLADQVPIRTLAPLTHNIFDFTDRAEFRRQVLDGLIDEIHRAAGDRGLQVVGSRLDTLREVFLRTQADERRSP
jgi:peptidoglycan/xylan/chitin deacetylase (PgdA/CDA1 family)